MRHRNCGGNVVIDVTNLFLIQTPSMIISEEGIFPGMLEICSNTQTESISLVCRRCNKVFSTKSEFEDELEDTCSVCGEVFPISKLHVSNVVSKICTSCKERPDYNNRLISLYGSMISKGNMPSLLTVITRKGVSFSKKNDPI